MKSPALFNYSDAQWRDVVAAIPPSQLADVDLDSERTQIEQMVMDFRTMTDSHGKRFADGSIARETITARNNINAALAYAKKTRNPLLRTSLQLTLSHLDRTTNVDAFDMLAQGHKGRSDPALALLYLRLLQFWTTSLNGKLTIGRSGGAKTSAAIRFLVAALAPIHQIEPETAAMVIKKERERREAFTRRRAAR